MPVKSMSMPNVEQNGSNNRSFNKRDNNVMHFKDTASAAQAAAESAEKAVAAAQAATYLANTNPYHICQQSGFSAVDDSFRGPLSHKQNLLDTVSGNFPESFVSSDSLVYKNFRTHIDSQSAFPRRIHHSQKSERSSCVSEEKTDHCNLAGKEIYRRHSYNVPQGHSDIKFDDSDCDEEIEMEEPPEGTCPPPNQPPPLLPRSHLHPKLPDYDALSAHFKALKFRRSLD